MSQETSHEAKVRETVDTFFRLLGEGDAERVADVFAEEIDWFVPGHESLPWTGHRSRRQQVPEYFRLLWPAFVAGESEVAIEKIFVDGSDAVALGRFAHTVKATGRRFAMPVAMRFTVAHGQIVRMYLYEDTALVAKSFEA